ncbi:MAG: hypothetical protein R3F43_24885 [bacterium]
MKQAYILRREGRDYQAPDLDTLRSGRATGACCPATWCTRRAQAWYRPATCRSCAPCSRPRSRRDAIVSPPAVLAAQGRPELRHRQPRHHPALGVEGNIDPDDYIYHPSYRKWFRRATPPAREPLPAHLKGATSPSRARIWAR